jgi:hypothetical protein
MFIRESTGKRWKTCVFLGGEDLDRCLQEINASTKLITEGQGKSGMGQGKQEQQQFCVECVECLVFCHRAHSPSQPRLESFGFFWLNPSLIVLSVILSMTD